MKQLSHGIVRATRYSRSVTKLGDENGTKVEYET